MKSFFKWCGILLLLALGFISLFALVYAKTHFEVPLLAWALALIMVGAGLFFTSRQFERLERFSLFISIAGMIALVGIYKFEMKMLVKPELAEYFGVAEKCTSFASMSIEATSLKVAKLAEEVCYLDALKEKSKTLPVDQVLTYELNSAKLLKKNGRFDTTAMILLLSVETMNRGREKETLQTKEEKSALGLSLVENIMKLVALLDVPVRSDYDGLSADLMFRLDEALSKRAIATVLGTIKPESDRSMKNTTLRAPAAIESDPQVMRVAALQASYEIHKQKWGVTDEDIANKGKRFKVKEFAFLDTANDNGQDP